MSSASSRHKRQHSPDFRTATTHEQRQFEEEDDTVRSKRRRTDTAAITVASHYNKRPSQSRSTRQESKIIKLRTFNNWVKSVLINEHSQTGMNVLDMGCGKGGDLMKWSKQGVGDLTAVDIASVSIQQAKDRYAAMRGHKFNARFFVLDCYNNTLSPLLPPNHYFDLVSMQFCMHYAFASEHKVRQMLSNVSERLKVGGTFIATVPNAYWIVKKLKSLAPNSYTFGNSIYRITFTNPTSKNGQDFSPSKPNPPESSHTSPNSLTKSPPKQVADRNIHSKSPKVYGQEYIFHLEDAIDDCPEYLVHWPSFVKLASTYSLKCLYRIPFHNFYAKHIENQKYRDLFYKMKVIDTEGNTISAEEWEAVGIYMCCAFRKV